LAIVERLQDRLKPYRIAAAVPEARRGKETRVDMLMLTGACRNLPLEAKRHFHPDIWTAASKQLQGYAAADGADGRGIYFVFWFGNEASPTPARSDGGDGPRSARELESMLVSDLPPGFRARTDVIVFDVSDPEAPETARPRCIVKLPSSACPLPFLSPDFEAGQQARLALPELEPPATDCAAYHDALS